MIHNINPDQDEGNVEIGRAIHESSYLHGKKEVSIPGMKIDRIFTIQGETVVGEIKKSNRFTSSAKMQLAFYLYNLRKAGISARGKLLFPRERKEVDVLLTDEVSKELEKTVEDIKTIGASAKPPEAIRIGYCKKCAYKELCWS